MDDKALDDVLKRVKKLEQEVTKLKKLCEDEPVTVSKSSHQKIIDEWNSQLSPLGIPKITSISGKREKLVAARIREHGKESFHTCIEEVKQSSFLQGKTKKAWSGFSFDWMVLPSNFPKVLEGNYNDNRQKEQRGSSTLPESWLK